MERLAVAEVAGECGEALAELGDDGSKCVEFGAEAFVATFEIPVAREQRVAGFDESGDLVGRESVAHHEGPAESFDLVGGEFHRGHVIELVFVLSRETRQVGLDVMDAEADACANLEAGIWPGSMSR